MTEDSVSRPGAVRWVGLGLLTLLLWGLAFGMVSGLSTEYGSGVVDGTTIVVVALVGGFVIFALARQMFAAVGTPGGWTAVAAGGVAAAGVIAAAAAGDASGVANREQHEQAAAAACDSSAEGRTLAFAREVGRVGPVNGDMVTPSGRGCYVNFVVPKTAGAGPVQTIDEALGGDWRREGESTWVAKDGFRIETRIEEMPPDFAEDEVQAWGSSP